MNVFRTINIPKPVGTFPDTLTLDDPLPPPRGTLCEGGRAPRYMLGWVLSTQEARELFSVPENYRSSQVTDYLEYHLLPERWALSSGLEMYKPMMSPLATFWYEEGGSVIIVIASNRIERGERNYVALRDQREAFLKKYLDVLQFDDAMLERLRWHKLY